MAQQTNYKISSGADLNTVFAPIFSVDYGNLSNTIIGENWVSITPTLVNSRGNNVSINGNALSINNIGVYRLNIALNFGNGTEQRAQPVFVLSSTPEFPFDENNYTFVPSPSLSNIYAMNVTGGNGESGQTATNRLNRINLGNCLSFNKNSTNFSQDPYFFTMSLEKADEGDGPSRPNLMTVDITFTLFTPPLIIYPQILLRQEDGPDPTINLVNSKWMITKISDI